MGRNSRRLAHVACDRTDEHQRLLVQLLGKRYEPGAAGRLIRPGSPNTNALTNAISHTIANPHAYAVSDTDPHAYADPYAIADSDANPITDAGADAITFADAHPIAHPVTLAVAVTLSLTVTFAFTDAGDRNRHGRHRELPRRR